MWLKAFCLCCLKAQGFLRCQEKGNNHFRTSIAISGLTRIPLLSRPAEVTFVGMQLHLTINIKFTTLWRYIYCFGLNLSFDTAAAFRAYKKVDTAVIEASTLAPSIRPCPYTWAAAKPKKPLIRSWLVA